MDIYFDYADPTTVVTNEQAINNSIRNIILTDIGSLPGKPTFGSHVRKALFEFIDGVTQKLIETYIASALIKWEPRIRILSIVIKNIPEYNRIVATITYQYQLFGKNMEGRSNIILKD